MKNIVNVSLLVCLVGGLLNASDDVTTSGLKNMFRDAKVSGNVRIMHDGYNQEEIGADNTYSTAIGGILKYELADFKGFNAGVAVYTSNNVSFATGNGTKQTTELSSTAGSYAQMTEAYLNYKYEDFNLRAGRQVLETPLANADDRSMIQNTFNSYVLSYSYSGFEFMAGNIQTWQGVDADLDLGWSDAGSKGTNFGGVSYSDGLELGVWYYNVAKLTNAAYVEIGVSYDVNKNMNAHVMLQYLNEKELSESAIGADIYGALVEVTAYDVGMILAYNKSVKKVGRNSFSGFGGGALFTSMNTMIVDEIADDRAVGAYVAGASYSIGDFGFLYAYGDFDGGNNGANVQARIVEQDMGFEYNVNEELLVSAIYVLSEDKESSPKTGYDWQRAQVMLNYNF